MSSFFIHNPQVPQKYQAIGIRTRQVYEFGEFPVRVDDPDDIEKFRAERFQGMLRLIETDHNGVILRPALLNPYEEAVPQSVNVYRPSGESSSVVRVEVKPDSEAPLSRQSGLLPAGARPPATQTAMAMAAGGDDDDDLGENKLIQRRAARGLKTRT